MKYKNQFNIADSYYKTMYDYCLDLVEKIVFNNNWKYEEDLNLYTTTIKKEKNNDERLLKVSDFERVIELPINELNDYFRLQNFDYVFNRVLDNLKIRRIKDENGNLKILLKKAELLNLEKRILCIKQATVHSHNEYELEDYIHIALSLLFNSTWKKDGMGYTITSNTYYDEYLNKAVFKIIENDKGINRIQSYKNLYMDKEAYKYFKKELLDRLNMLEIEKYDENGNDKLFTMDINKSKSEFLEYYDEGIKLSRRN